VRRRLVSALGVVAALSMTCAPSALAQGLDVTLFAGRAYPLYEERLTFQPAVPALPGVDVAAAGPLELRAGGGLVAGGAVAFEVGLLAIEGRLDLTDVRLDVTGTRLDLRAVAPPFEGLTGSLTLGDGRLDVDRLRVASLNLRLRTPGPVALVASGGLSYLANLRVTGTAPLSLTIAGVPIPAVEPRLRLEAAPGARGHQFGVNGGAGLRLGGRPVALMAEVRAFYFREFELRFGAAGVPALVADVLDTLAPVRFEPIIVNAQAGLVFRF
jgi:hypothetical protein